MDLNKLKQANRIYESLADKTIDEAMSQLNTYDDLDQEVFKLIKSLINNSQQSSAYFDRKFSQHYQIPPVKNWQVGDQIDGYELLELIGHGGMSVVYKAQRINSDTQKPVAIKLFNLPNQSPDIKARFKDEQSILAGLSHPNVIEFHHGENTDQGDAYIVMELIEGGLTIDEYVKKNQLNSQQTVTLLIRAAEALQYAHNHLIIHRDIKPSNIMINVSGQLKVLDFGIAKLLSPKKESDLDDSNEILTENTLVALTPSYASPEQINAQPIDVTSDVFSLAAVAVVLLTGQQPFPASRMLNACTEDEIHVRGLLKTCIKDRDLRHILAQALHQEKNRRYANMFAFSEDLNAWLEQKPVSASKDSWWYRLNRFAHRRTALFVTSLGLAGTVVAAIVALSLQNQAIKIEAKKAAAVKNFMLNAFSVTDPKYAQGVDLSTKDYLHSAANKIIDDKNLDANIKFELNLALATAHGKLGYYPQAIDLLNQALSIKPNHEHNTALLAQYLFNAGEIQTVNDLLKQTDESQFDSNQDRAAIIRVRANLLAQAGQYDQALATFESLELTAAADPLLDQPLLAEIYYLKGESDRSIEIIQQLKKDHPMADTDVINLGLNSDLVRYHDRLGNFKAALILTENNIQSFRLILGDQHPSLGQAYNDLSVFQRLAGQLEEAIESAKTSQIIFQARYGEQSEGLAQALGNIGVAHYFLQQPEPAINNLTKAADMLATIFGDDHPETMNAKANLATILNAVGYPESALPILERMYEIEVDTLGKSHRSTLYTQQSLALNLANLEQYDAAINHAKESTELINSNFTEHNDFKNHASSILGRVYYMADEHDLAVEHNLQHIENWTEGNENTYARSLQLIAGSYQALGALEKANEYFQLWTDHLSKIYGQTDVKYLDALLKWAARASQMQHSDQAITLLNQVQSIINDHDLKLEEIQTKLDQLKIN